MAAVQRRRGPNVVGFWGLLQPLADGVKLFAKEMVIPSHSNGHIFLFAPIAILTLSLLSWSVIPFYLYEPLDSASISSVVTALAVESEVFLFSFLLPVDGVSALRYSVLFLLAISSLNVYGIIIAGWSSSSKYAFLGSLRSAAQMISYEVSISLILLSVVVLSGSLDLVAIVEVQRKTIWFVVPLLPSAIIFFISMLAETNRAPFDLPEAEAELVAGYNVEYSSIIFAMFFLGEYSNMILMSTIASLLFLGGWASCEAWVIFSPLSLVIKIIVVAIFFILVRASYPRYRYDQLMDLGWKVFLPVITGFFIFEVGLLKVFGAFPKVAELPVYTLPNTGDAWTLFSPLELNSVSDLVGQIIFILGRNFFLVGCSADCFVALCGHYCIFESGSFFVVPNCCFFSCCLYVTKLTC
jgi:NADH-quinone oxidoreductase subunit H